jgi:hypothetical protein
VVDTGDADRSDGASFKAAHQDTAQGIAQGCGLATLERTDQENACLGAILGDLMLDAIDLVLQHGLKRSRGREPERRSWFRRGGA